MRIHVLNTRCAGAAEHMAADFLLLQRYPAPDVLRFRHYEWRRPAMTFGYAQKIAWVREQLPAGEHLDLCRRPTGGGIVDHREDWTYALVIPRGHPIEEQRAVQSYARVHEALAGALGTQGVEARLQPGTQAEEGALPGCHAGEAPDDRRAKPAGVCFARAEPFDVVHAHTGVKLAGAAQKRTKHGLLFQGSIQRPALDPSLDWERFQEDFVMGLAACLGAAAESSPWPEWHEGELEALTEQYGSAEWLEYR